MADKTLEAATLLRTQITACDKAFLHLEPRGRESACTS